jgi:hypothetical protein
MITQWREGRDFRNFARAKLELVVLGVRVVYGFNRYSMSIVDLVNYRPLRILLASFIRPRDFDQLAVCCRDITSAANVEGSASLPFDHPESPFYTDWDNLPALPICDTDSD